MSKSVTLPYCGAVVPTGITTCLKCGSTVRSTKIEFSQQSVPPNPEEKVPIPPEFLDLKRPEVQQPLSGSFFSLLLMVSFTLLGAIFLMLGIGGHIRESNSYRRLTQEGVVVQGLVWSLRMEEGDSTTYHVDYQFTAPINGDPTRIQGSQSVSSDLYRSLREGQTVQVRYAASDPYLSTLEAAFAPPNIIFLLIIGGMGALSMLVGLAMAVYLFRNMRSLRRLRLYGRQTSAFIFDRWEDRDPEGLATYCIAYAFKAELPDGGVIVVRRAEQNKGVYGRYQVGDPVPVRYLPTDPTICQLQIEKKKFSQ